MTSLINDLKDPTRFNGIIEFAQEIEVRPDEDESDFKKGGLFHGPLAEVIGGHQKMGGGNDQALEGHEPSPPHFSH
jgi:hypothetical protein